MPHVAWTLTDNSTGSPVIYSFPINPNQFDVPGRTAQIESQTTTGPNGTTVLFQGKDEPPKGSMSGAVTSEAMRLDLETWTDKWYVLTLTDDQSRAWDILITNFSYSRLRRATNQNRFDYKIDFLEI